MSRGRIRIWTFRPLISSFFKNFEVSRGRIRNYHSRPRARTVELSRGLEFSSSADASNSRALRRAQTFELFRGLEILSSVEGLWNAIPPLAYCPEGSNSRAGPRALPRARTLELFSGLELSNSLEGSNSRASKGSNSRTRLLPRA